MGRDDRQQISSAVLSTTQRTLGGCKEIYLVWPPSCVTCAAPNVGMIVGPERRNANHIMISMGLGGLPLRHELSICYVCYIRLSGWSTSPLVPALCACRALNNFHAETNSCGI
jgi:hypothetical protein